MASYLLCYWLKKDGTSRFFVDQWIWILNVKDNFSISRSDELSDELYGSKISTKLDLRSGYHQTRMVEADIHKTAFELTRDITSSSLCHLVSLMFRQLSRVTMNELFKPFLKTFVMFFLWWHYDLQSYFGHPFTAIEPSFPSFAKEKFYFKLSKYFFSSRVYRIFAHDYFFQKCGTWLKQDWGNGKLTCSYFLNAITKLSGS